METNYYRNNPEEYKRIIRLIEAGLRANELNYLLTGTRAWHFARALGLQTDRRRKGVLIATIHRKITSGNYSKEPTEVKEIEKPNIEETDKPVVEGPECDGCGGVSTFAEVLRWGKVLKGKHVSYRVVYSSIPDYLKEDINKEFFDRCFSVWSSVCGIKFKEVRSGGDIVIEFGVIDGAGKILGATFQPANGLEMDVAELSGNITIDSSDRWLPEFNFWTLFIVMVHEIGHAIGLKHNEKNWRAFMSPTPLNAGNRMIHPDDVNDALELYPLNIAA